MSIEGQLEMLQEAQRVVLEAGLLVFGVLGILRLVAYDIREFRKEQTTKRADN